jgi:hypothetical protein
MKRASILFLFFVINITISNAQEHYFIVFCGNEGVPGHAYVFFGRESSKQQASVADGAWGLYPTKKIQGVMSYVIGEVPGRIMDEGLSKHCDYKVIREVSKKEYENGLKVKKNWSDRGTYDLTKRDCVSFMIAVAQCVNGLDLPERSGLDNFPSRYVKALFEIN